MKVLILINKVGLGDCIIHLNYIHEISKKYEKPVSILAKENTRAKDLFQDDPHIKEVITLDRLEDETGSHDGLNGFIKLIKDIKEKKFDKVFIFNSSVRYFLVCKFAGIKKIAQYPLFKKKEQHIVNTAKIFTENELGKIVKENIGDDVKLELIESNDNRSYHISSSKIKKILGFETEKNITDAVLDLKLAFEKGLLPNSLNDDKYFNIKTMKKINLK